MRRFWWAAVASWALAAEPSGHGGHPAQRADRSLTADGPPRPVAFLHTGTGGSEAMEYVMAGYARANNLSSRACRTWGDTGGAGVPVDAAVVTASADAALDAWDVARFGGGGGAAVLRDLGESYKAAFGARRLVAAVFHHPLDLALATYLGSCDGGAPAPAGSVASCGFWDFERVSNRSVFADQWVATLGASTLIPTVDDDAIDADDAADRVEMTLSFLAAEVDLVGSADLLPLTMVVWAATLRSAAPLRYRRGRRARDAATSWLRLNEHAFE